METKIPKIIHWCWLSEDPLPESLQRCVDSWKKVMPDYEIKCWDKSRFDINSIPFVRSAYDHKKYAIAADYIRLYALYNEGGIYFDSDVMAFKPLDDFLNHDFFSSIEAFGYLMDDFDQFVDKNGVRIRFDATVPGIGVQAAMFGAVKGHPLLKDCLDFLGRQQFVQPDGSFFYKKMVAPALISTFAEKYGFRYLDKFQQLDKGIAIYAAHQYFGISATDMNSRYYAVHCCAGSWHDKVSLIGRIKNKIKNLFT